MNGLHPSTSINFGTQYSTTVNDPSLSFLSNPMGLSFFGNSNSQASNTANFSISNKFSNSGSTSVYSRFGTTSNVRQVNLNQLWDIGRDNPIIDDDEIREQSWLQNRPDFEEAPSDSPQLPESEITEATPEIEIAEGIAEGAEVASSATPWGLLALLNTQMGQSLNSAITTGQQNQASQDYQNNMNQHGVNVALNASLIQQNQEQTIRAGESGGAIGSLFGPIGTLIGHAVAGTVQANPSLFATAASSSGWVDPTNSTAANSASTASVANDSTMQDNVD